MSKIRKKNGDVRSDDADDSTLFRKMTRLLEILVRLNLHSMKGDRSPGDMISLLKRVGCGQSEIADLLGIPSNTVKMSLYRSNRKAGKK
jgi:hypothetical protein